MSAISRILVATDFSDHADRAVARAAQLAARHGAALELLHAVPMPTPMPVWGDMAGATWIGDVELAVAAGNRMRRQADELAGEFGIEVGVFHESGPAQKVVQARVAERGIDLVVIGATGEGAWAQRLFGSNAQAIVRAAHCPVLVVRLPAGPDYQRLLVASDLSDHAAAAARLARSLAPEADVAMFGALEQPRVQAGWFEGLDDRARSENLERARTLMRDRLRAFAGELGAPDALVHVRDGRASHELAGVLADVEPELLSVGAHGKTRLEAGMLGSVSQHALNEARCDVLVVPPRG
jgi:nucleotide-binding universal stress UspA family protein